jgi:hypothetical protein
MVELLRDIESGGFLFEDGEDLEVDLLPGLTPEELSQIESRLGAPLPADFRQWALECGGVEGFLGDIDFSGEPFSFDMPQVFPRGLPIAADGFGNHWVLDVIPADESASWIFYVSHDPPIALLQCRGVEVFLEEAITMHRPPFQGLVRDVYEDRLFDVWKSNPGVLPQPQVLASADPALRAFADELDAAYAIVDLRHALPGQGFSWGRYGPDTIVQRYGEERMFAYGKP